MQIYEITQLNEQSILKGIKSAAATAKSAVQKYQQARQEYQQTRQDQATQQSLDAVLQKALPAWNKYTQQLKATTLDPERYQQLYKQALIAFVQKYLLKGQPIANAINRQEILADIDKIVAAADDPTEVKQRFRMLIRQAALAMPDPDQQPAPLQVRFISVSPPVLQFRNKTYVIGDQGKWSEQLSGSIVDQATQVFFDQQLAQAGVAI